MPVIYDIIKFKCTEDVEKGAQEALKQIFEQRYAEGLRAEAPEGEILCLGIAHFKKRCAMRHGYGEANEENEFDFKIDVDMVLAQMEIYDQVWYTRLMPSKGDHSAEAISLVREIVARLEAIPDGCAETFPFETIDALKSEYLAI